MVDEMSEIHCPMCSKPNPEHLETCQHCGARLTPLIAPTPQEEPQARPGGDSQEDALSWLRSLGGEETADAEDQEPVDEGDLPNWLADERSPELASLDTIPYGELPPWLRSDQHASGEEPSSEPGEDWLADLRGEKLVDTGSLSDEGDWGDASQPEESPPQQDQPALEGDWLSDMRGEQKPSDSIQLNDSGVWADEETPDAEEASPPEEVPPWLKEASASTTQPPPEAESLPDWLKGEEDAAATSDWLDSLSTKLGDTSSAPPLEEPTRPIPASQLPDWLRSEEESAVPDQSDDLADWLLDDSPAPSSAPTDSVDWLDSLEDDETILLSTSQEPAAPSSPPGDVDIPEEDVPDWLAMLDESKNGVDEKEPQADPDWTQTAEEEQLLEESMDEMGALTLDDEDSLVLEIRKGEMPDWLESLQSRSGITIEEEPDLGIEDEALRSWVTGELEMSIQEGEEMAAETQADDDLPAGELPDWVRAMRPVDGMEAGVASEYTEGEVERVGPLSGLRGLLPAEPEVARPGKPSEQSTTLQISARQRENIALLSTLIAEEAKPQTAAKESILSSQRLFRALIAGVLILAVLLPIVGETALIPFPLLSRESTIVAQMINQLPDSAPVLVVFDYEPGFNGELEAAASVVVDHLMLRGSRLTLVSSNPISPLLAERQIAFIQEEHQYTPEKQYTNLGYIPGAAPGLFNFARAPQKSVFLPFDGQFVWELIFDDQDVWQQPALQGVASLKDFGMTVVVTDDPDTARIWIEQVEPALRDNSLVMVLSAQAAPLVQPYVDSADRQVMGTVVGLAGGVTYEQFQGRPVVASKYWDSFGLGILAALGLILAGGGYNYYLFWNSKRSNPEG